MEIRFNMNKDAWRGNTVGATPVSLSLTLSLRVSLTRHIYDERDERMLSKVLKHLRVFYCVELGDIESGILTQVDYWKAHRSFAVPPPQSHSQNTPQRWEGKSVRSSKKYLKYRKKTSLVGEWKRVHRESMNGPLGFLITTLAEIALSISQISRRIKDELMSSDSESNCLTVHHLCVLLISPISSAVWLIEFWNFPFDCFLEMPLSRLTP